MLFRSVFASALSKTNHPPQLPPPPTAVEDTHPIPAVSAGGKPSSIVCTGVLANAPAKKPNPWWGNEAIAIIHDGAGHTCMVDRANCGHDPLKPCSAGEICTIAGVFEKPNSGNVYWLESLTGVWPGKGEILAR